MSARLPTDLFEVETVDQVQVVKLNDTSLDELNIQATGEQLLRLVDEPGPPTLHVDFGGVKYVGSMGLAKFVALHKKVKGLGGNLALCNVNDPVYQAFQVTQLTKVLDVRRKAAG